MAANHRITRSRPDVIFDVVNTAILAVLLVIVAYPLYFVIIASVSEPNAVQMGKVVLWPTGLQLTGYQEILKYDRIWTGYRNTALYTVVGTTINLVLTLTCGFALSQKNLPGRKTLIFIFTFTMFFNGGMIPTYIVVRSLNLVDKRAVMIILGAVNVWNLVLARSFFESSIPADLREAAFIDGCNYFRFFFQVVLPLSGALTGVLMVYYAVAHWNQFFNGIIYLRSRDMQPLQVVLREMLIQDQFGESTQVIMDENAYRHAVLMMSMKYGVIIVSSLPVLIMYPFVQRFFVKGVMVGAIKG